MPRWLANLITVGGATTVNTTNQEQVPLTGRTQLMISWPLPICALYNVGLPAEAQSMPDSSSQLEHQEPAS